MARPYAYTPRRRLVLQGVMVLLFAVTMLAAYGVASRRAAQRPAEADAWQLDRRAFGDGVDFVNLPAAPRGWGVQRLADGGIVYTNPVRTGGGMRTIRVDVRDRRKDGIATPDQALADIVSDGTEPDSYRKVRSGTGINWRVITLRQASATTGPVSQEGLPDGLAVGGRVIACAVPLPGVVATVELRIGGRLPTDADGDFLDHEILEGMRFSRE